MLGNSLQIIFWCDFSEVHSQNEIESDRYCAVIDYTQTWIIVSTRRHRWKMLPGTVPVV